MSRETRGSTHDRICRPGVVAWSLVLKLTVIDVAMVSLWLGLHYHSVGLTLHQVETGLRDAQKDLR